MQRIQFQYPYDSPTETVTFESGLQIDAPTWSEEAGIITQMSFNRTMYAYRKGVVQRIIPLKMDILNVQDRDNLIDFVLNTVYGSFNEFKYIDQDADEHRVRFLDEEFNFDEGTYPYSVTVTLLRVDA